MRKGIISKLPSTVALFLVLVSLSGADRRTDRVDKLFMHLDRDDSPGCALAIIQDGQIIYKRGYGMANLENHVPVTPKSVFYIGSCSKQFVAMCIALLAKQGKLAMDDNIRKYVPEIPDYGTPVTIRHLIYHTSGIRDYLALLDIAGIPFGYFHESDVLELLARQEELNFSPGDEHLYSNSGYFLLALIVKRTSGMPLREFARKHIFNPLGMKNSHFHDDYTRLIKNRASGYFPAGEGRYKNYVSTFDCVGSGGLYTSVEDLFLWDQNFYHHKVGGKELAKLILTPGKLNNGEPFEYAFALKLGHYRGLNTVSHGGALGGYRAAMIRFLDQKFSVICLSNLSTFNPTKICRQISDIYLADRFKKEKEKDPAEKARYIKLPEERLKEKVGFYVRPGTGEIIRLFFRRGKLIAKIGTRSFPLAALSETEFQVLQSPVKKYFVFEKPSEGKPFLMREFQPGKKPRTFTSARFQRPDSLELGQYTGDYYSPELHRTFRLALKKNKLFFVHKNSPQAPLRSTLKDYFSIGSLSIRFVRDGKNRITAFILNAGRVRNLRFHKK